ncbi:sensor histidine kinase [Microbacterium sp. YY-01]|uniref:sensor histidine kinase n=1 Tax=Microbacterium sp. YY-01 TaxID=3421634 RepID=UPI003D17BA54
MAASHTRATLQWFSDHPRARDGLAAGGYFLLGLAALQFGGYRLWADIALWYSGTAFIAVLAAMSLLATQRSSRPFLVLGIGTALAAVDLSMGGSIGVVFLFADFIYCAFRYGSDKGLRMLLALLVATVLGTALTVLLTRPHEPIVLIVIAQWLLVTLFAGLWGWSVRAERQRTRALMLLEHTRDTEAFRRQIAHDLHDKVANEISVAGLHIEAARLRIDQSNHPTIDRSLELATEGTDRAHEQLRQLIGVLTAGPERPTPASGTPPLESLMPQGRTLIRRGDRALPDAAQHTGIDPEALDRVVRELVMNAIKHGTGDVTLTTTAEQIRVSNSIATTTGGTARPDRHRGNGIGLTTSTALLRETGATLTTGATQASAGDPTEWHATITLPPSRENHHE